MEHRLIDQEGPASPLWRHCQLLESQTDYEEDEDIFKLVQCMHGCTICMDAYYAWCTVCIELQIRDELHLADTNSKDKGSTYMIKQQ